MKNIHTNIWWGPPKKFSTAHKERKISWLELFYDLVYVIAISTITHRFSENSNLSNFLDFLYIFPMIFWGWLNGSLHHDLHGSTGLRTNLMTLWQMAIVAALVITLNRPPENLLFDATIAIMVMQIYITYLWWSVGIYDKSHRKLNKPYTICYLISFALIVSTLFLQQPFIRIIFLISLILNYLPPFIGNRKIVATGNEFSLSPAMVERLGTFVIIVFGEVVLGVINGTNALKEINLQVWINFVLALLVVFSLWWIFFSIVGDKKSKPGFLKGNIMALGYIPLLMALTTVAVGFTGLFSNFKSENIISLNHVKIIFGLALSIYLISIFVLSYFLNYSTAFEKGLKNIRSVIAMVVIILLGLTFVNFTHSNTIYLLIILIALLAIILIIQKEWFLIRIEENLS